MSDVADAPGTALALLGERALVATEVFKPGGVRVLLDQIKAEIAQVEIDISTPEGRKACASLAYKVARSKTALDAMGKTLTDQWRKQAETVHAERRLIEKELDALANEVRAPLTEWENIEKARVKAHEDAHKALDREAEERRQAEVQRIRDAQAASAQAQRDLDAKIAAEQAAAKARAENVAHRRKFNREALTAVLKIIQTASSEFQPGDESLAQAIIEAVAKNEIPHMRMEY